MEFKEKYPNRVALGEDGIYRWSFDVDLNRDMFLRNLILKIMGIICGGLCVLMLLMEIFVGDFSMAWVSVATCGAIFLIGILCYYGFKTWVKGIYTVAYEMNEDAILLIQKPSMQKAMQNSALLMTALGIAMGKPVQGIAQGAGMYGASRSGLTRFKSVRRFREDRATHMISLGALLSSNQVWVPAEDYDMVRDFLKEHTNAAIKEHEKMPMGRWLGISAAVSAAVNGVIMAINAIAFRSTARLPLSITEAGGTYTTQRSVGMSTIYMSETADIEAPWWTGRLEMNGGSLVLCFLLVMGVVFLALLISHLLRRKNS